MSYLTRDRWPGDEPEPTKGKATEVEIHHQNGNSRLVILRPLDELDPVSVKPECDQADAIGILFYGAQPAAGLNALVNHPCYPVLAECAERSFLIFGSAAVYDEKLQDLVLDLVDPVDEHTPFKGSPWYVCDTGRYDARYTDFIEVVREVRCLAGPARQIGREWTRGRHLSVRRPFDEASLIKASDLIDVRGGL